MFDSFYQFLSKVFYSFFDLSIPIGDFTLKLWHIYVIVFFFNYVVPKVIELVVSNLRSKSSE